MESVAATPDDGDLAPHTQLWCRVRQAHGQAEFQFQMMVEGVDHPRLRGQLGAVAIFLSQP